MPELDLAQNAQHWVNVVLIWIGFGTVVGLLAKTLLPLRQPSSFAFTLMVGVVGSLIGLLALSLFWGGRQLNPISPLGVLAATAGALLLLVGHRVLCGTLLRREKDAGE